jgi:hypothetical protein
MVRCKKHGLVVTGCSRWMGNYPSENCENCDFKGGISAPSGNTKGLEETIRTNVYRLIKNKGTIVKNRPTLRVHPYFKGGSYGKEV